MKKLVLIATVAVASVGVLIGSTAFAVDGCDYMATMGGMSGLKTDFYIPYNEYDNKKMSVTDTPTDQQLTMKGIVTHDASLPVDYYMHLNVTGCQRYSGSVQSHLSGEVTYDNFVLPRYINSTKSYITAPQNGQSGVIYIETSDPQPLHFTITLPAS